MTASPARVAALFCGLFIAFQPAPLAAQLLQRKWVDVRDNITGGGVEEAQSKMTMDAAGNVFTAGRTDDLRTKTIAIRKIDATTGLATWEKSYTFAGSSSQSIVAIAADPAGNLIATGGVSNGGSSSSDCYVSKFAAATGELLWQTRYNGPGNLTDTPGKLVIDAAGNPSVIGSSDTQIIPPATVLTEMFAIKLDAATGAIRWDKHFTGPIKNARGTCIAARPGGNVIVSAGFSSAVGSGGDVYLAEYDSATGAAVWEKTFNSPDSSSDQMADLTLDSSGNIALTGNYDPPGTSGVGILTLKYSAAGDFLWERRLPAGTSGFATGTNIAADSAGNFIVYGYTSSAQGYLAKYAAATGAVLWTQTPPGFEANSTAGLDRLALDPSGNPCLTGNSKDSTSHPVIYTIKYSSSTGAKVWDNSYTWDTAPDTSQVRHGAFYLSADAAGNLVSHGMSTNPVSRTLDQYTIKYSPQGTRLWMNRYDGPYHRDDGTGSVALDFAGDVLTTGYQVNETSNRDLIVRKQDGKTGAQLWKFVYQSPSGLEDEGQAMAVDAQGNAFVGGVTTDQFNSTTGREIYFAKHASATGASLWKVPVTTTDSRFLVVKGMTVGADGNPILIMEGYLSEDEDIVMIKFSGATGAVIWRQSYSAPVMGGTNYQAAPRAVTIDSAGNLIVAANIQETGNFTGDIRTLKFSGSTGAKIREMIYNGPGANPDSVAAVAVDPEGNIAITGYHATVDGSIAMFTRLYRVADGSAAWTKIYSGPDNNGQGTAIAMDAAGNVFVTGHARNRTAPSSEDGYIAKYAAADGAVLWEKVYPGLSGEDDIPAAIVIDSKGNPLISGYSGANIYASFDADMKTLFTAKYSGVTGESMGSDFYTATAKNDDEPPFGTRGMAIGVGDRVVVCGQSKQVIDKDVVTLVFDPDQAKLQLEYPAGHTLASGSTVNFGLVPEDQPGSFTFTIRNVGNADLILGQPGLTGEAAAFRVTPLSAGTVAAAGSATFSVRAQSDTLGPHAATLSIPSNDPDANPFVVQLNFTTPSRNANLASLSTDGASFSPAFSSSRLSYHLTVPFATASIRLTPVTEDSNATVKVNDTLVLSGAATAPLPLAVGTTSLITSVTAQDARFTRDYVIQVTRLPQLVTYLTGAEVPISADGFVVGPNRLDIALGYAPLPGTTLTVVENTSIGFIEGSFSNLGQGQIVVLQYGGVSYRFVVNYYGGSGNDLVLQWADTAAAGWGANGSGQLGEGDGSRAPWLEPAAIPGLPQGSTVFALAAGSLHSLCLTADGAVSTWGSNTFGQLGDGTKLARSTPQSIGIAGKRVIAIAAGAFHSLALCEDGKVYAWGYNNHGQLGNGSTNNSLSPVPVAAGGVLAGKTVVAISAGAYHSLALCSDGSVAAWGFNGCGALGNDKTTGSPLPVNVILPGGELLHARALSAGQYHNLAIGSKGELFAWGYNNHGQVGNGSTTDALTATALHVQPDERAATLIASGGYHSLALFDDGSLAEWGLHTDADGNASNVLLPVHVPPSGALAGKQIVSLAAGADHSLALCSDGSAAGWGSNLQGQLGTGDMDSSPTPRAVATGDIGRLERLARGSSASHALALLGLPLPASALHALQAEVAPPLPIGEWRQQHFGSADNTGEAADEMDPDHDGLVNLVEYAFALDPRKPDADKLPAHRLQDGYFAIEFIEPAGVTGVTYSAVSSRSLREDAWLPLADEGSAPRHLFRIPSDPKAGFIRLQVTSP